MCTSNEIYQREPALLICSAQARSRRRASHLAPTAGTGACTIQAVPQSVHVTFTLARASNTDRVGVVCLESEAEKLSVRATDIYLRTWMGTRVSLKVLTIAVQNNVPMACAHRICTGCPAAPDGVVSKAVSSTSPLSVPTTQAIHHAGQQWLQLVRWHVNRVLGCVGHR